MKKVLFTALIGDRDELRPPGIVPAGWEAVCFSDRIGFAVDGWRIVRVSSKESPRLTARRLKIVPPFQADVSVWMDASFSVCGASLHSIAGMALDPCDVAAYAHPDRDCVYAEADACRELDKAPAEDLEEQKRRYRAMGYPERAGLCETGILFRRHSDQVEQFNRRWLAEVEAGTVRDQVSFPVAAWACGLRVNVLPAAQRANFFTFHGHRGGGE